MGILSVRRQAAYTALLFVLLLLLVPHAGHESDMSFWIAWAKDIFYHGLGNVYQSPTNSYSPLYHYVLWLFGWLMGDVDKLIYYHNWLKAFTLVFDFAGAFWAASLVRERDRRFGLVLLLLFNIGYLYNTLIWIQVDAIYTLFVFGAVVLAVRQQAVASMLFFVLSLATKPQALIFLPPLLMLWVPLWWHQPRRLGLALGAGAVLMTLVLAPFIWFADENYFPRILAINTGAAGFFPYVSMNAYNLWYVLVPSPDPTMASDLQEFSGLTYRTWGLLMFFAMSVLALGPLFLRMLCELRQVAGPPKQDMALALLCCGLVPLLFAFFNTQMHERYWHAAILFLAGYGFLRRDYLSYILASVAYFLNLEGVLMYLKLRKYSVLIFQPWFVASLFGLAIIFGLVSLYRMATWRNDWVLLRQSFGSGSRALSSEAPALESGLSAGA